MNVTAGCISSLDDWQVLYNPRLHSNKLPLIAASVFQYFSLWKFAPPRYSSVWLHWYCHSPVKSGAISHSLFTNDMAVCQELSRAIKTPPSSSLIQKGMSVPPTTTTFSLFQVLCRIYLTHDMTYWQQARIKIILHPPNEVSVACDICEINSTRWLLQSVIRWVYQYQCMEVEIKTAIKRFLCYEGVRRLRLWMAAQCKV